MVNRDYLAVSIVSVDVRTDCRWSIINVKRLGTSGLLEKAVAFGSNNGNIVGIFDNERLVLKFQI